MYMYFPTIFNHVCKHILNEIKFALVTKNLYLVSNDCCIRKRLCHKKHFFTYTHQSSFDFYCIYNNVSKKHFNQIDRSLVYNRNSYQGTLLLHLKCLGPFKNELRDHSFSTCPKVSEKLTFLIR